MADLHFKDSSAKNTTIEHLEDETSVVAYIIETPSRPVRAETTTIYKGSDKESGETIGTIELHEFKEDIVEIRGVSYLPRRAHESSTFSDSKEFTASDGQAYKWKRTLTVWELLAQDGSHSLTARYERRKVSVQPQAVDLVDEILITLLYMMQKNIKDNGFGSIISAAGPGLGLGGALSSVS